MTKQFTTWHLRSKLFSSDFIPVYKLEISHATNKTGEKFSENKGIWIYIEIYYFNSKALLKSLNLTVFNRLCIATRTVISLFIVSILFCRYSKFILCFGVELYSFILL